jgi:hypothetical protein
MSLKGAIIQETGTVATTGGTPITYSEGGKVVSGGVQLQNNAIGDFRVRPTIIARYREPKLQSDGTYSKGKHSLVFKFPKILESGATVFNIMRLEREVHPESSTAEALELNIQGAQAQVDADFTQFWAVGSLS